MILVSIYAFIFKYIFKGNYCFVNNLEIPLIIIFPELAVTKGWAYNALERYHKEKKDWGEADYGETSAAYSAVAELENQIKSLKWVIEV